MRPVSDDELRTMYVDVDDVPVLKDADDLSEETVIICDR